MKQIKDFRGYLIPFIISLQVLFFSVASYGQEIGSSTMNFGQSVYNFGTIREQDGVVSHIFEFTNRGKRPFVIENVAVSCGCTTPTYSKAPILPGKKGTIEIKFDPAGRPGEFLKEIVITSDNRSNRNIIKIKGNVTPRPRTVEDDYPIEFSSGIRASMLNLNFRYVGQGRNSSMTVALINTSPNNVTLGSKTEPANNYIKVAMPATLGANHKGEITVTYDFVKGSPWGVHANNIYLIINGVRQNVPISATAIFVDDFSAQDQQTMENAPRAKFSSQYYNFGDIGSGDKPSYDFTVTNTGDLPLIVRDVSLSDGLSVSLRSGTTIAPQKTATIKVTFDSSKMEIGRQFRSIILITNDPMRPMREIRLAANIQ